MMGSAHYTLGENDVAGPYFKAWLDDLSPNEDPEQVMTIRLKCADCFAPVDGPLARTMLESAKQMKESQTEAFKAEHDSIMKKLQ
jgi:hypothetical protein